MRQHQSRQSQEHLLGPNWSLQRLMASCGCVFTSHLFCMHCFPASETSLADFNSVFPQLSVSFCLSSSFQQHKSCVFLPGSVELSCPCTGLPLQISPHGKIKTPSRPRTPNASFQRWKLSTGHKDSCCFRELLQLSDPVLDGLRSLLFCLPSKSVKNIIFIVTQINVSAGELFSQTGMIFISILL